MEQEHQQRYYELGKAYWWLAGKYRIIHDVIRRAERPAGPRPRVLDLGCGPGNFLDFLAPYGETFGSDFSVDALRFCVSRGYPRLFRADFHSLPIRSETFDIVTCIDVLEHLQDDRRAARELARVLRPSGLLVVTVPAFQFLWGDHDTLYGHYRRYRAREVRERLSAAGLQVTRVSYFEPLFVAPLWLFRKLKKLFARDQSIAKRDDFVSLSRPVNAALTHLLAAERFPLRFMNFPFGVTLLATARKPG
jgi:SAM-dependent methyltransferase